MSSTTELYSITISQTTTRAGDNGTEDETTTQTRARGQSDATIAPPPAHGGENATNAEARASGRDKEREHEVPRTEANGTKKLYTETKLHTYVKEDTRE